MHHSLNFYENIPGYKILLHCCTLFFLALFQLPGYAQTCPANIDFEEGSFAGWTCYTGYTAENSGQNVISLEPEIGPIANRHTIYNSFPNDGFDEYGGFPINCPNGSGHSIKLGNDQGGGQAEGLSYEFTIPSNENIYTLIYNYAVVFQDPSHLEFQQPRMVIEIKNVTDNRIIDCSSFTFFPNGSPLPGFQLSPISAGDAPVWYKEWSAVSINLDGNAGKKIRLFFKSADCTFRRHFGYAYIDVNSECSGRFLGASFCHDDTAVNVVAPYGYQEYQWYNSSFTQMLGTQQVLTFSPPPAVGTGIAVIVKPYNGYGCLDTLYTDLLDNLTITAKAGRDTVSCNDQLVQIGSPPIPGEKYKWSPATGLSDPDIANPVANPPVTTTYILNTRSLGGGCSEFDTVVVRAATLVDSLSFSGKESFCLNSGDSAVLRVQPTDTIQWFRDGIPIAAATQSRFNVTQTGKYFARLANVSGCIMITETKEIKVSSIPVSGFTIDQPGQCLVGNNFIFTNASTNQQGEMLYNWNFGDSTFSSSRDVSHVYNKAGVFNVKLTVRSNQICVDSSSFNIHVYQNPVPQFTANGVCINLSSNIINQTADTLNSTINYSWVLGNGQLSNLRTPPSLVYANAGVYVTTLSVSSVQCPLPLMTLEKHIIVDKPRPGISYPTLIAVEDLPLTLKAREIGAFALWSPAANLDNASSFQPVFSGASDAQYRVAIRTQSGCVTIDTQLIKIVKEIAIYVPSAFTPNDDGANDVLRPVMYGIKKLTWFKVFNRWGQLMFQSDDPSQGWNGIYKGKKQEMQTYVWILQGLGANDKIYSKKGTTILMR